MERKNRILNEVTGEWEEYYTSISFPWTVAKSQFWRTTKFVADGKLSEHNLFATTAGEFSVGFAVPHIEDQTKHDAYVAKLEQALKTCSTVEVKQVKYDDKVLYGLFIGAVTRPVAILMNDHIHKFAGNSEVTMNLNKAEFNGKNTFRLFLTF